MPTDGDVAAGAPAIPVFTRGSGSIVIPPEVIERNERISKASTAVEWALQLAHEHQTWDAIYADGILRSWKLLQVEAESLFSGYASSMRAERKSELFRRLKTLDQAPAGGADRAGARADIGALDADEFIEAFEPAAMLLDPILARGHVGAITAHPNAGKTSIMIQLALAVAGLAVLPGIDPDPEGGRVLYLAGDSDTNFAMQLIAAIEQHDIDPAALRDRFVVVPTRFSLLGQVDVLEALAKDRGGFALVVVDTRAAYSAAEQEDDNMQALADALALRRLTRIEGTPTVMVLCHPSKHASRDQMSPRGGSAFLGEIDENLTLWNDGDGVVELAAQKRRIPDFEPLRWRFEVIDIDRVDARGRPVRSVRACRITDGQAAQTVHAKRQDENRLLHAMLHHPHDSQADWARQCGWLIEAGGAMGQPHKSKVARLLGRLKADKLVECFRGIWRLTESGKREAQKAE